MKDSFDHAYAEHRPAVMRIAQKLTRGVGGKPVLDGLVAAGMVTLWQAHESYDPSQGTFWQYAYLKVRGTMVDELRVTGATSRSAAAVVRGGVVTAKQSTGLLYPVSLEDAARELTSAGADALAELTSTEEAATVRNAVEILRGAERRVVVEHFFEGRNLADVGAELGVTESRACQLKKRALAKLEAVLGEHKLGRTTTGERRGRRAHLVEWRGRSQSVAAWARELGVSKVVLSNRLTKGWNVERAFTEPVHQRTRHGTSVRGSTAPRSEAPKNAAPKNVAPSQHNSDSERRRMRHEIREHEEAIVRLRNELASAEEATTVRDNVKF